MRWAKENLEPIRFEFFHEKHGWAVVTIDLNSHDVDVHIWNIDLKWRRRMTGPNASYSSALAYIALALQSTEKKVPE